MVEILGKMENDGGARWGMIDNDEGRWGTMVARFRMMGKDR